MKKVDLKIDGMGCMSCVNKIKNALANLEGVNKAEVDLKSAQATIDYDDNIVETTQLVDTIKDAGYSVKQ